MTAAKVMTVADAKPALVDYIHRQSAPDVGYECISKYHDRVYRHFQMYGWTFEDGERDKTHLRLRSILSNSLSAAQANSARLSRNCICMSLVFVSCDCILPFTAGGVLECWLLVSRQFEVSYASKIAIV